MTRDGLVTAGCISQALAPDIWQFGAIM